MRDYPSPSEGETSTTQPTAAAMSNTDKIRAARDQLLGLTGRIDEAVEQFRWPDISGPFNWGVEWFDAIARGNDTIALWLVDEDGHEERYSYDELATRSDQVAQWLVDQGIGRGDVVMIMLGNQVELWDVMLAVIKIGAVILPTAVSLISEDLQDRVQRAGVKAVVCSPGNIVKFRFVDGAPVRIVTGHTRPYWQGLDEAYAAPAPAPFGVVTDAHDPVIEYFTSGTTKVPKLVEHTQLSYPVAHLNTMYFIGVRPGDIHLNISSPGWGKHAWSSFFSPWLAEATVFCFNYARFNATALLEIMRRHQVSTFCAPPTVWRMMIQADLGDKPPALREVVGAGEPLNPEVIEQVRRAWGLVIRDGYGQTETTAQIGNVPGVPVKPGSMGKILPGVPAVIIDPLTEEESDTGEIRLKLDPYPFNLMTHYIGNDVLDAEVKDGGYYHTGDLAVRDEHGYLTYVGRTDDVFKASDYKVSPFELESVLLQHPAVVEAAVVPAKDPTRLAVPKAFVSLAPGWEKSRETALEILGYAKEHLAPYLRVRRIEFPEDLPKTISGKIRRVVLREKERRRPDGEHADEFRYEDFPELKSHRPKPEDEQRD